MRKMWWRKLAGSIYYCDVGRDGRPFPSHGGSVQFFIKICLSLIVIIACARIGRRFPTLGGLIATMPLTSLLVMLWLWSDAPGDYRLMVEYTKGVLWGIIPTVLFFAAVFFLFRRQLPLGVVLGASFGVWLAGAVVHQYFLK